MEYFPTLEIIGDYLTKALQGSQFCRFRNIILGIHEDNIPTYSTSGRALLDKKTKIEERERRIP